MGHPWFAQAVACEPKLGAEANRSAARLFVVKASRQELTSFARRIEWRGYHSAAFFADCVLIAPAKANSRSPPTRTLA